MQLEGNFPDPVERPVGELPLGAGLRPAASSSRAPGVAAVSPASSPSRISVGAGLAPAPLSDPSNHATLHSSSPSLPAVNVASSSLSPHPLPTREGRGEGRSGVVTLEPELDDLVPFLEPAR